MAEILFEGKNISLLVEEFVKEGNFTYPTISKVFGPMPVQVTSPDTDAMLDAWNDRVAYSSRIQRCEEFVRQLISSAETKIMAGGG